MINQLGRYFRVLGVTACIGIINQLNAEVLFTVENKTDAPWDLRMYPNTKVRMRVMDGSEEIKAQNLKTEGGVYDFWKIKEKHIVSISMKTPYRGPASLLSMYEHGHFLVGDSNGNYREFELSARFVGFKDLGYSIDAKSPMAECKSSGDNNDDGVTELKMVDSKPVVVIKLPSYPRAIPSQP